jgi:hypothetical protein
MPRALSGPRIEPRRASRLMSSSPALGDAARVSCGLASTPLSGSELIEVADAYEQLAEVAGELADEVEREDRVSRLLSPTRTRRSA